jgi:hypothetical protein
MYAKRIDINKREIFYSYMEAYKKLLDSIDDFSKAEFNALIDLKKVKRYKINRDSYLTEWNEGFHVSWDEKIRDNAKSNKSYTELFKEELFRNMDAKHPTVYYMDKESEYNELYFLKSEINNIKPNVDRWITLRDLISRWKKLVIDERSFIDMKSLLLNLTEEAKRNTYRPYFDDKIYDKSGSLLVAYCPFIGAVTIDSLDFDLHNRTVFYLEQIKAIEDIYFHKKMIESPCENEDDPWGKEKKRRIEFSRKGGEMNSKKSKELLKPFENSCEVVFNEMFGNNESQKKIKKSDFVRRALNRVKKGKKDCTLKEDLNELNDKQFGNKVSYLGKKEYVVEYVNELNSNLI